VGSVLAGRYRIVQLLGKGAMGAVYLGEHLKIGRKDAIKVLQASLERDSESIARFTRGARNASSIRHPNVCTVYDFGETHDGLAFLAMEFVDGESLSDLLKREGTLPLEQAGDILSQVGDALSAAHAAGIVHRDLKPANVMLAQRPDGSPLAKVVDFDIAKGSVEGEGDEVTRLGYVVGTPEFMSPEQLTGDPLDGRSDVYSLGVLLFRALTGSLPHIADSTQELMVKRLTESPMTLKEANPGNDYPTSLQALVDRSLQRKAADRLESASAFSRELRRILAGVGADRRSQSRGATVPATEVSRPEHLTHGRSAPDDGRKWWLIGAGAVALVAGVAVGAMALRGGGGHTVTIEPATSTVMVDGALALASRAVDDDGNPVENTGTLWSSDTPEVAAVDQAGRVTGNAPGTADITATVDGEEATATVTVVPATRLGFDPRSVQFRVRRGDQPESATALVTADGPVTDATVAATDPTGLPAAWLQGRLSEDAGGLVLTLAPDARGMTTGQHDASLTVTARPEGQDLTVMAELPVTLIVEGESDPEPPDRGFVPTPEQIEPLLTRQEVILNGIILGDLPRSAAEAVDDTARAVLAQGWLTQHQRAEAAFVLAGALLELRSCAGAVQWAQEAVRLAPDERGYRTFLEQAERCGS
jgi:predicted Ser/Thr protein kinase